MAPYDTGGFVIMKENMMNYNDPIEPWMQSIRDVCNNPPTQQECGCLQILLAVAIGLLFCALLGSCTTVKTVETVRNDTVWENHTLRDSVWVWCHDSIVTKERSDTVTIERWHWRDRWRERVKTDTVYMSKIDTVAVTTQTAKPLVTMTRWQQIRQTAGDVAMVFLLMTVAWYVGHRFGR